MTDRTLSVAALAEILRHHGNLTRARRANLTRPDIYADLVTAGDLIAGWLIAHEAGTADGTEMAVLDTHNPQSMLTVEQASTAAGVTRRTIRRAIADHRLTATRQAGRWWIAPTDLAAYHPRGAA